MNERWKVGTARLRETPCTERIRAAGIARVTSAIASIRCAGRAERKCVKDDWKRRNRIAQPRAVFRPRSRDSFVIGEV